MIRETYMSRRFVWFCLLLGLLQVCPLLANDRQRRERPQRQRPRRENTQNRRENGQEERRQLPPEGVEGIREIESTLKEILTSVNQNQRPAMALLDSADQLLVENKRYLPMCDTDQRVSFMLMQAWAGYYADDLGDAMSWAVRASKTDETNQDAWISAALFCMLNDKKPLLPRLKPTSRQAGREREGGYMAQATASGVNLKKGTLEFDVLSLRQEMFSERFQQIDYQKEWGAQIDYESGADTLCLLFWESDKDDVEVEVGDANDVTPPNRTHDRMPRGLEMMGLAANMQRLPEMELSQQRRYFVQLSEVCKKHPHCKFVEVNTDEPETAKKAAKAVEQPAVPLIFAAETGLEPEKYAGLGAAGPFMLVINPEGKLRYAGPAADFVPAFVLTAVTGIEIDLEKMDHPNRPAGENRRAMFNGAGGDLMGERMPRRMPPRGMPPVPAADPNEPAVQNTAAGTEKVKQAPAAKAPAGGAGAGQGQLTVEQQVDADHLLAEAQLHIEGSIKIRGKSPEAGIIACREVMKKYPNTDYATKAQMLLRDVPNRFKAKYDITYEELGY